MNAPLLANLDYLPLYGEAKIGRCRHCGNWRSQHTGRSVFDGEMNCLPPHLTTFTRFTTVTRTV